MIFRVLVVLDPTLCELEYHLCGTVRQREEVDVDVLQDRQLPPRIGAIALNALADVDKGKLGLGVERRD
jgi:hypothetical protein